MKQTIPFLNVPEQPTLMGSHPVTVPHWLFELVKEAAQPEVENQKDSE